MNETTQRSQITEQVQLEANRLKNLSPTSSRPSRSAGPSSSSRSISSTGPCLSASCSGRPTPWPSISAAPRS
ncbi:MAG: hypothetical protein M0C28_24405 [Candidatus Moduliflexus flocculans]|nr:hypothetical protein [Candidatus Moduliflexus flocculans]